LAHSLAGKHNKLSGEVHGHCHGTRLGMPFAEADILQNALIA